MDEFTAWIGFVDPFVSPVVDNRFPWNEIEGIVRNRFGDRDFAATVTPKVRAQADGKCVYWYVEVLLAKACESEMNALYANLMPPIFDCPCPSVLRLKE